MTWVPSLAPALTAESKAVYKAALLRALVASVVTGALTFFTALATTSDARTIISVTGVAIFTPLVVRFGWEGTLDAVNKTMRPKETDEKDTIA